MRRKIFTPETSVNLSNIKSPWYPSMTSAQAKLIKTNGRKNPYRQRFMYYIKNIKLNPSQDLNVDHVSWFNQHN